MPPAEPFPRQHARTRRFTLGAPRNITVSRDGATVLFCRSGAGDDPVNRLWRLDVDSGSTEPVADPIELVGATREMSVAERARRERAREAAEGIVTYATDPELHTAVFALAGRLYRTDVANGETAGLPAADGAFDPRPAGDHVGYVAGGQLRVTHLIEGDRVLAADENPDVSWGLAEFIAAEEMGRSRGFWWAPDGDQLIAARVDSRSVTRWHISSPVDPAALPTTIRYPAAGTANARVELALIDLAGHRRPVRWDHDGFEYLAAVDWSSTHGPLVTVQSRDQRTVAVLAVDPASGQTTERYRWTDEVWIDLVTGSPTLWNGRLLTVEDRGAARRLCIEGTPVTGDDLQVLRIVHVGQDAVTIAATTEPTEIHVMRVDVDGGIDQMSTEPGVHSAASGGATTVITSATLDEPRTTTTVCSGTVPVTEIDNLAETPAVTPIVDLATAGPDEIRTAVLWPRVPSEGPLPILLDPYGGPHALRVQRSSLAFGVSQWFADQGFCVVIADGRGTPARGPAWERAVRADLAGPVLADQIAALEWVIDANGDRVDPSRVGIRGWSFGGYLAALAVLTRPDLFHAAIAGAPVTDWRLYDTHYTERYLGHPDHEPENYVRTDLTTKGDSLERPLLLIHGLADDNVVAAHTLRLSRALLEAGRPHQVLPLSGVTHMTPQEEVAENLLNVQLAFLDEHLRSPHGN